MESDRILDAILDGLTVGRLNNSSLKSSSFQLMADCLFLRFIFEPWIALGGKSLNARSGLNFFVGEI